MAPTISLARMVAFNAVMFAVTGGMVAGRKLEYPRTDVATFKKAPRRMKAKRKE